MSDNASMKGKQFIQKLRRSGVRIIEGRGKGGHVLAVHHDKQATVPFHGAKDIDPDFLKMICRQLGLDPNDIL